MNHAPHCPYCNKSARLVGGSVIYPDRKNLHGLKFWMCAPCQAWVGCHREDAWTMVANQKVFSDGTLPLGRLANAELRMAKMKAHEAFDPIWKREQGVSRSEAYTWLRVMLGMHRDVCHIGEFDVAECEAVVRACLARQKESNERQKY